MPDHTYEAMIEKAANFDGVTMTDTCPNCKIPLITTDGMSWLWCPICQYPETET